MDIEPSLRWRARATPRHVLPSYSSHRPSHVAGMVAGLLKGQSGSGWLSLGFVLRVLGVFLRSLERNRQCLEDVEHEQVNWHC